MPSSTSGINEQGTSITLQLSSHMSLCAPHMHRPRRSAPATEFSQDRVILSFSDDVSTLTLRLVHVYRTGIESVLEEQSRALITEPVNIRKVRVCRLEGTIAGSPCSGGR